MALTAKVLASVLVFAVAALLGLEWHWPTIYDAQPKTVVERLRMQELEAMVDTFRLERGAFPNDQQELWDWLKSPQSPLRTQLPPDTLGHAYIYKKGLGPEGYLIYSAGRNGIDENGEGDDIITGLKKYSCDDYDERGCPNWSANIVKAAKVSALVLVLISLVALLTSLIITPFLYLRKRIPGNQTR